MMNRYENSDLYHWYVGNSGMDAVKVEIFECGRIYSLRRCLIAFAVCKMLANIWRRH
jgi:hypothetical protein